MRSILDLLQARSDPIQAAVAHPLPLVMVGLGEDADQGHLLTKCSLPSNMSRVFICSYGWAAYHPGTEIGASDG